MPTFSGGVYQMSQFNTVLSGPVLNLAISVAAIVISVISLARQLRLNPPNVMVLNEANENEDNVSPVIAHVYERLPQNIRDDFPIYDEPQPYYAPCSVVIANSGD